MNEDKEQLFWGIWNEQEIASSYIAEYDSIPHLYGEYVMYQAEGQIIDLIAQNHNITCSELAEITKKTPSACSQIVRKLKDRGFVIQTRNEKNNRKYNLSPFVASDLLPAAGCFPPLVLPHHHPA